MGSASVAEECINTAADTLRRETERHVVLLRRAVAREHLAGHGRAPPARSSPEALEISRKHNEWLQHAVQLLIHNLEGLVHFVEAEGIEVIGVGSTLFISSIRNRRTMRSRPPGQSPVVIVFSAIPTPHSPRNEFRGFFGHSCVRVDRSSVPIENGSMTGRSRSPCFRLCDPLGDVRVLVFPALEMPLSKIMVVGDCIRDSFPREAGRRMDVVQSFW